MIYLDAKQNISVSKSKEYILDSAILLAIIQVARVIIKYILLSQLNLTLENVNIINIVSIMLVGVSTAFILRGSSLFNSPSQRLTKLNNRYNNRNVRLISGAVTLICILATFYLKSDNLLSNSLILTLCLIIQPVFEEIIFREYVWNYVRSFEKNETKVLIIVSILSAIFKLGYWDIISQNLSVIGSSYFTIDIIMPKVFWGFIVAMVLGMVKIKYKDTCLCIFGHSFINIFFRVIFNK